MPKQLQPLLDYLKSQGVIDYLSQGRKGLEKEGLRYSDKHVLSTQPHPAFLGHPLTHDSVTTDYAESLLEIVTPAFSDNKQTLDYLDYLHRLIAGIDGEYMLNGSIPAHIDNPEAVEIGYYGESNPGKMRRLYRKGLALRYGKAMQLIAGIHYNYSIHPQLWEHLAAFHKRPLNRQFIDEMYMNLVRNIRIHAWVVPYLFGHSPVIDKSFFHGKPNRLHEFDDETLCLPYATSLRASDIGYQNKTGSLVGSNSLDQYVSNLCQAVLTPSEVFAHYGLKDANGKYQQINTNILQIENEYYTVARAKQITNSGESPIKALKERGTAYVELRTLDINCFAPLGVDQDQLDFLELYMLYNLLTLAPQLDKAGERECEVNTSKSACCGRDPSLRLSRHGQEITIADWGEAFIEGLRSFIPYLKNQCHYDEILDNMLARFDNPDLTPSARIVKALKSKGISYHQFITQLSAKHAAQLKEKGLSDEEQNLSIDAAKASIAGEKAAVEKSQGESFEDYLASYFAQLKALQS